MGQTGCSDPGCWLPQLFSPPVTLIATLPSSPSVAAKSVPEQLWVLRDQVPTSSMGVGSFHLGLFQRLSYVMAKFGCFCLPWLCCAGHSVRFGLWRFQPAISWQQELKGSFLDLYFQAETLYLWSWVDLRRWKSHKLILVLVKHLSLIWEEKMLPLQLSEFGPHCQGWNGNCWVLEPDFVAQLLSSYVMLGELLSLSGLVFLICKMVIKKGIHSLSAMSKCKCLE